MDILNTLFKPAQSDLNALGIQGNANVPGPLETMTKGANPMEMIPGANANTANGGLKLLDAFIKLLTSPQGQQQGPSPGESSGLHPYNPAIGGAKWMGSENEPQTWKELFSMYPEAMEDTDLGISIRERFHERMQGLGKVGERGSYARNAQNMYTTMVP